MNLVNIFARIRLAFRITHTPRIYDYELSEHLRKDMGLHNPSNQHIEKGHVKHREDIVTYGIFTRAP